MPPELTGLRTARERVNTPIWLHSRHSGSVILAHPFFSDSVTLHRVIVSVIGFSYLCISRRRFLQTSSPPSYLLRSSPELIIYASPASLFFHQLPPLLITARLDTLCSTASTSSTQPPHALHRPSHRPGHRRHFERNVFGIPTPRRDRRHKRCYSHWPPTTPRPSHRRCWEDEATRGQTERSCL